MAEAEAVDRPPAQLPEVPGTITAAQIIALLLSLAALRYGREFLVPLLVAILAAVALAPPVHLLARAMPRWLAAAIVVLGIATAVGAATWMLWDDATAFTRRLPAIVRDIRGSIQSASPRQSLIRQLQQAVSELEQTATPPKAQQSNATPVTIVESVDVQQQMMTGARRAGNFVMEAILLLFLVYFLLATGDVFKRKFVKLSGDRFAQRKVTQQMIDEITTKIGRYVFYMFWSGALVGTTTWLAFWWLGVRYAGLWGVAAGFLNCIPYFGPTAVMVGSAVAALVQFNDITMVAAVSATSVAITSLEGYLLTPIVLGRAARVNSVAVFISVMFWGWMWGVMGMLLAVPILMMLKTVADHVESLSSVSELLGER